MKEYIWGIVGTIVALISLVLQFIKEIKVNRRERRAREQEAKEMLSLKICNQIEYFNGVYRIKFINISQTATAYNLKVSIRIKNRHFNYTYKIPDVSAQEAILSSIIEKDKELCEMYVRINVLEINYNELEKNATSEVLKLYKDNKLELKDLLKNNENYLAVRYNAVNRLTGKTIDFAKHEFVYADIVCGRYGIGNDIITPLN